MEEINEEIDGDEIPVPIVAVVNLDQFQ